MVSTLLQHIADTHREARVVKSEISSSYAPVPPQAAKSSKSMKQKPPQKMRQICGLNYFNREVTEKELAVHSRFFEFPATADGNERALQITSLPGNHDHNNWSEARKTQIKAMGSIALLTQSLSTAKAKRAKHLNLAQHLVNFSSGPKCNVADLSVTSISTFTDVANTRDPYTASCALLAISNISSMKHVRNYILENNMMHAVANIIPLIRGPTTVFAASLLFYYFSIDAEAEDRVYNTGGSHISTHGVTQNRELQILSLKTLSNLLPCGDRLRVVETIMRIVHIFVPSDDNPADFEIENYDRDMALVYLPIISHVSSFTNTHSTLFASDICDLLAKTAIYCQKTGDAEIGQLVGKILLSFLQVHDSHVTFQFVSDDNFIFAFEKLLEIHDTNVLKACMHGICVMSGVPELTTAVCDSEMLAVVAHTLFSWDKLPPAIALDTAMYYNNVCQDFKSAYLERLAKENQLALAIMTLISKAGDNYHAQQVAVRGLQNLLTLESNCHLLCDNVMPILMQMIETHHDLGAAQALYNVSCALSCVSSLRAHKVHIKMLHLYTKTNDLKVRKTYLQIICQMFYDTMCIHDIMDAGIVDILSDTITGPETSDIWPIMVKIALNIVNNCTNMTEKQRLRIVGLLKVVCVKTSPDDIIGKASVVLAYLSLTLEDFSEVDTVLRSILALSSHELVYESASVVLYNLTCSEKNASIVVRDALYVNIMINIMRSSLPETQQNIAKAMRTLCSLEQCTELMMNSSSLSDLIVIALLRSSSEDIKVVCSQAFYNMLTHFGPREALLRKGDLWWAITRICKNDSMNIRLSGAKALLDLSIDAENSFALRTHHVMSFVHDLITGTDIEFIDICMKAVQNLCSQFDPPFALYELTSLLQICAEALVRCKDVTTLRGALIILVNITIQRVPGWDHAMHEVVNILSILDQSLATWGADAECRGYVSSLLWNMTSSRLLVKSIPLTSLNQIMNVVYQGQPSGSICENLLGTLLNYITVPPSEERASKATILEIDVVYALIFDAFGVGPTNRKLHAASCGCFALTIFAYVVSAMNQDKFTSEIIIGVVNAQADHENENFKLVVHELSKYSASSGYLMDANIFAIFLKSIRAMKTTNEKLIKYISCSVRNISMHRHLVPRVLTCTGLDLLVRELLDTSTSEDLCLDIALMLFYAQEYSLQNHFVINSEFALSCISAIMQEWKESSELTKICKYTLGEVLEKYSAGVYVDPAFVQSMYTEMKLGNSSEVIAYVRSLPPRALHNSPTFSLPDIKNKASDILPYFITVGAADQWKPFLVRERKRMVTEMLDKTIIEPIKYENLLHLATIPHSIWSKIEDEYPRVKLPSDAEVNQYFGSSDDVLHEDAEDSSDKE